MRLRHVAIVTLLTTLIWQASAQDEWTRFRGPDGTGIGKAEGLPIVPAPDDYAWKVKLPGPGHSSPVRWGNRIFLTCVPDKQGLRQVVCLDAADGRLLWSWDDRFEPYKHHKLNSYGASTPAVDAERAYVTWVSGKKCIALALDHEGKLVWQKDLGHFDAWHGAGSSPIAMDDIVIVVKDNRGETSFLVALDSATGEIRWKHERKSNQASYITPAVYRPKGKPTELIFASVVHGISSLDPTTGRLNWEVGDLFKQKSVACPVIAGDVIMASAGKGGRGTESAVVRVKEGKGELAYHLEKPFPYVPTPIAIGAHFFVLSDQGVLSCVAAATGKLVWREKLMGEKRRGVFFSSPVCVDGRIYCIGRKGKIFVIEAAPRFKLLGQGKLPEGTHATPAIASNAMYIRTFNHLICVRGKATD